MFLEIQANLVKVVQRTIANRNQSERIQRSVSLKTTKEVTLESLILSRLDWQQVTGVRGMEADLLTKPTFSPCVVVVI
jgi:hypothetical protein